MHNCAVVCSRHCFIVQSALRGTAMGHVALITQSVVCPTFCYVPLGLAIHAMLNVPNETLSVQCFRMHIANRWVGNECQVSVV